ncbi:hypothetical protein C173_09991, partial [Paenibacillus sp. FSL R7-277]|uniref:sacsin N-terminal ATP-binding-like domain-containing protein n=1 Tax=Paenibacillus sp. FSL R7-277 TaxID=1227352 RepID=UPI0003E21A76
MITVDDNKSYIVADWFARKTRSFLDELRNGTDDFASITSLTKQITHDYHSRFIIELVQNAHDALLETGGTVRIIFDRDNLNFYVANTGDPLNDDNFKAICKLGQSSKEPNTSIGNKGIGFKSVLEITEEPEIYSGPYTEEKFSGYSFRFSPAFLRDAMVTAINQIIETKADVELFSVLHDRISLPNWSPTQHEEFYSRWLQSTPELDEQTESIKNAILRQVDNLSPYQFPIPIVEQKDPVIARLGKRGFATVIKLPLRNESMAL